MIHKQKINIQMKCRRSIKTLKHRSIFKHQTTLVQINASKMFEAINLSFFTYLGFYKSLATIPLQKVSKKKVEKTSAKYTGMEVNVFSL